MHIRNNRRERKIIEEYQSRGFRVLTKGWPDLLCIKDGKIEMVEVKRRQRRPTLEMGLSSHQRYVHEILKEAGFAVRVIYVD